MKARTRQTAHIPGAIPILTALAALSAPPAWAQTPGAQYYAGLHLGQHSRETWPASVDFGGVRADGALELARASHAGLMLGRQGQSTRLELEYQRGRVKLERITLANISEGSSAGSHYATAMLNAYWQPRLTGGLSAFAGLGAGWASVSLPDASFSNGCHCFGPARKRGSAWQLRLGAEYKLAPQHAVFLAWTRLRLPGPHADGTPSASYRAQHFNAASLGYRYLFQGP
ncbi:outer membrane protein [Massilia sp. YIM B04103]|uniref:outer membrane protein n=1 Tax=Massilia sp. YIM B04103 TaxID=2963106 RepID=UPI00210EC289|nr:outer membrane beta-barrel protein [Massilia sp. YIM B04103]